MEKTIKFKDVQVGQRFKQAAGAEVWDTKVIPHPGSMIKGRARLQINVHGDDGSKWQLEDDMDVWVEASHEGR